MKSRQLVFAAVVATLLSSLPANAEPPIRYYGDSGFGAVQFSPRKQALDKVRRLGGTNLGWADDGVTIVDVVIAGSNASDHALYYLGHLTDLRMVRLLPCRKDLVTDAGISHLAGLTKLQYLGMTGTGVTDAGLPVVRGMTDLRFLELSGNITDAGMPNLVALKELEFLKVYSSKISDAGLVPLKDLCCLRGLHLANSPAITNAGLVSLRGLIHLEMINLRGTGVSAGGLAVLKAHTDGDLMCMQGPFRLKTFIMPDTLLPGADDALIRLIGMNDIAELPRQWSTPKLSLYRAEMARWRTNRAYVEFTEDDPLPENPADAIRGLYFLRPGGATNTTLTTLPRNITRLAVPRSGVSDSGLPALAGLPIQTLNIYDTGVTPAGLDILAELGIPTNKLIVDQGRFTAAEIAAFEQATGATVVEKPVPFEWPDCCPRLQTPGLTPGGGPIAANNASRIKR
jgi:hypothetical protein